jgi:hypothetical protein
LEKRGEGFTTDLLVKYFAGSKKQGDVDYKKDWILVYNKLKIG